MKFNPDDKVIMTVYREGYGVSVGEIGVIVRRLRWLNVAYEVLFINSHISVHVNDLVPNNKFFRKLYGTK